MYRIVDTNVLLVASNKAPQASRSCSSICAVYLQELMNTGIIVIDTKWLIIEEYKNKNSQSGQPGVGDRFLEWLLRNQFNPKRCERVHVTQISENNFAEFPNSLSLAKFDLSDRKFVAVALTHPQKPSIANAVDSDWREHEQALAEHGIKIDFLCGK